MVTVHNYFCCGRTDVQNIIIAEELLAVEELEDQQYIVILCIILWPDQCNNIQPFVFHVTVIHSIQISYFQPCGLPMCSLKMDSVLVCSLKFN